MTSRTAPGSAAMSTRTVACGRPWHGGYRYPRVLELGCPSPNPTRKWGHSVPENSTPPASPRDHGGQPRRPPSRAGAVAEARTRHVLEAVRRRRGPTSPQAVRRGGRGVAKGLIAAGVAAGDRVALRPRPATSGPSSTSPSGPPAPSSSRSTRPQRRPGRLDPRPTPAPPPSSWRAASTPAAVESVRDQAPSLASVWRHRRRRRRHPDRRRRGRPRQRAGRAPGHPRPPTAWRR